MARSTIFIEDFEIRKNISKDYWYSYWREGNKGIFRVYKSKRKIFEKEASKGDAFELFISYGEKEEEFITPVTPPRRDWEAIAWLLGFGKNERACSYEEYEDILEKRREQYEKPGYVESILAGPNFEFVEYSIIDGENYDYNNLVCWIDEGITKNEILHLIPEFIYPECYLRKVLGERFNVSDEEFDKAYYE